MIAEAPLNSLASSLVDDDGAPVDAAGVVATTC